MSMRKKKHNYTRIKCPVLTAFRTLYSQIHSLIALHETSNDLMLYKDVSESATHEKVYRRQTPASSSERLLHRDSQRRPLPKKDKHQRC